MRKSAIIITSAAVVASLAGGAAAFAANAAPQGTLATTSATPSATPGTDSLGGATPGSGPVGVAWGNPADLDAAIAAALEETGPGTVVEADIDDDPTHAYEIDIRLDAGGFVEVKLDADFGIVSVTSDDDSSGDGSSDDASGESTGDDLPVTTVREMTHRDHEQCGRVARVVRRPQPAHRNPGQLVMDLPRLLARLRIWVAPLMPRRQLELRPQRMKVVGQQAVREAVTREVRGVSRQSRLIDRVPRARASGVPSAQHHLELSPCSRLR